ncbi:bifunctional proline dehydrogenase/L-glutamate gamma-semialdehyde dehydrogenase PutA [bacterium AH-315-K03]|nr:bifunctional proline dehydrogenase/L-glutamate gamma-semialdehyde dehydrogenase PutA [bacterium AH-315-K03]
MTLSELRHHIRTLSHSDEHSCVMRLRHMSNFSTGSREHALHNARQLTQRCRDDKKNSSALDAFLLEFGLSNKEGVALMCLAEALLRIPDSLTCDRLIAEKIHAGNWNDHNGQSHSLFVNASTWGLMLTGKIVQLNSSVTEKPGHWLKNLVSHIGEPVVRLAMQQAMKIMGAQYVLGRTISEALTRGENINQPNTLFSFDMLGEGARTYEDAQHYFKAYSDAIDTIGQHQNNTDVIHSNGISVKLSALHPRYHYSHQETVLKDLYPRIKSLCLQAKHYQLGLSIDAEEAERLDLSLDIFEHLAKDKELKQWQGLGFVLQAYQKRAPFVASWLIKLATQSKRRLMVRLVKGAYWDAEIKQAQEQGLNDYPVYTRKANTDLSYQYCAEKLLDAQEAIYPQFATHNAYTAAVIMELGGKREFEFQRLHGMGDLLYKHLKNDDGGKNIPVRVYAPVGKHQDLLPYLVRRLLENGANSSFVNRFLDKQTPLDTLINDVDTQVTAVFPYRHKHIATPPQLFQHNAQGRLNSKGIDLNNPIETDALLKTLKTLRNTVFEAKSIVAGKTIDGEKKPIKNPANHQHTVGFVDRPSSAPIEKALDIASQAYPSWNQLGGEQRANILEKMANALEQHSKELIALICFEAGRTLPDGLSEVREAIDFCRYYAEQAKHYCTAPYKRQGQGVFLCISPWNFPLAIFTGQIVAALAAGNTVIAKPPEQTPLIAYKAITLFQQAGLPADVLHFLPGKGSQIGKLLLNDPRLSGVCFTGSTETAQTIHKQLAKRQGPTATLIAETGGQNAMIVDSSALPEQLVDDIIASAFLSAGQRCSALRVLFLQEDIADSVITMLSGALKTLNIGAPHQLSTDIGPVIDQGAQQILSEHVNKLHQSAKFIAAMKEPEHMDQASFFPPHIFELSSLSQLTKEVFGPVLHIIRYQANQLADVIKQINNTGYGLTLGIHSRIESLAQAIYRNTTAGNTYINRNMVGAVVGVNPFGGQGLSGTGPKAGGPNYLLRFTRSATSTQAQHHTNTHRLIDESALAEHPSLPFNSALEKSLSAQKKWSRKNTKERTQYLNRTQSLLNTQSIHDNDQQTHESSCAQLCEYFSTVAMQYLAQPLTLPGPTGEKNTLSLYGRGVVICMVCQNSSLQDISTQICAALVTGCSIIVATPSPPKDDANLRKLIATFNQSGLPQGVLAYVIEPAINTALLDPRINAVTLSTHADKEIYTLRNRMAERQGAIIPLIETPGKMNTDNKLDGYALLTRFVNERTQTDNIVARGGDTQLFNLSE